MTPGSSPQTSRTCSGYSQNGASRTTPKRTQHTTEHTSMNPPALNDRHLLTSGLARQTMSDAYLLSPLHHERRNGLECKPMDVTWYSLTGPYLYLSSEPASSRHGSTTILISLSWLPKVTYKHRCSEKPDGNHVRIPR